MNTVLNFITQLFCLIESTVQRTCLINPLPDAKILDWLKLKEFADDKIK